MVCASWVNAMLIRDDFPELGTNLVAALTTLDVNKLAHGSQVVSIDNKRKLV